MPRAARRLFLGLIASTAVLALAPAGLAATLLAPRAGAVVAGDTTFTIALGAHESSPLVQIATSPGTYGGGFTGPRVGICAPSGTARLSCSPGSTLAPGTYYWLVVDYKTLRCTAIKGKPLCMKLHVDGPVRFTVSDQTQPAPQPQPTPPQPAPPSAPQPQPTPQPGSPTVAGTPVRGGDFGRPSEGGEFAFTTPEAPPFQAERAVIHYVTTGLDAPPLNDDNRNGVPDYVEQVAAAADTALAFYAARGYRLPLPDTAGGDNRPDIYIEHLKSPDLFGVTIAPFKAAGGSFVVISSRLDQSPELARGALGPTVAHELFHVVQYAYRPDGRLPTWVAEGSASSMELLLYPKIADEVMISYLDHWLAQPWLSLYDERSTCEHCYGGAWWWGFLDGIDPRLIPAYFSRLAATGKPALGVQPLDDLLRANGYGSLAGAFGLFSVALYRAGLHPNPVGRVTAGQTTPQLWVNGLSTHYVEIVARGATLRLEVTGAAGARLSLILGGAKGRSFAVGSGRPITVRLRGAKERRAMLIVANGRPQAASYRVMVPAGS